MEGYVEEAASKMCKISDNEFHRHRSAIVKSINGDLFFPLKVWPQDLKMLFFKMPLTDIGTFKIMTFLIGK